MNPQLDVNYHVEIGESFRNELNAFDTLHVKFLPQSAAVSQLGALESNTTNFQLQFQNDTNEGECITLRGKTQLQQNLSSVLFFDGERFVIEKISTTFFETQVDLKEKQPSLFFNKIKSDRSRALKHQEKIQQNKAISTKKGNAVVSSENNTNNKKKKTTNKKQPAENKKEEREKKRRKVRISDAGDDSVSDDMLAMFEDGLSDSREDKVENIDELHELGFSSQSNIRSDVYLQPYDGSNNINNNNNNNNSLRKSMDLKRSIGSIQSSSTSSSDDSSDSGY
jgi:hypothetical protein